MRTVYSIITALGVLGLTGTFANAESVTPVSLKYHYSTCTCQYGYGNVCLASAACDNTGGHCTTSCTPSNSTLTNR
jgi:hypothetical protein